MFKLFKKYLKPFGGLVIAAILFTFLQVVAELQLPDIMARIVDTGIYNKDLNYVIVRGLEMLAWAIGSVYAWSSRRSVRRGQPWGSAAMCAPPSSRRCRAIL